MLILPMKRKWFEMVCSGAMKEVYRDVNPYWDARIRRYGYAGLNFGVRIKSGCQKDAPYADLIVEKTVGFGRPEWGAPTDRKVYILRIIDIWEIKNKR